MFSKMRRVVVLSLFVVLLLSGTVVSVIQTTPAPQAPQTTQTLQAIPQTPEASGGNNTANISFIGTGIPENSMWLMIPQDPKGPGHALYANASFETKISSGFYAYLLECPTGYYIHNISVSIDYRNGTVESFSILVNQNIFNFTFEITINPTQEFPVLPTGASIHSVVHFVEGAPSQNINWYPGILVLIGIAGGALGIWDGNRRRRIKKGYKENEERKKMEGITENKTGTWKREARPRPKKETRKETSKEPTKETMGEPILDEDILRGQNHAPPETLPPANPEKKEEEEDDEEEDMEREETDEFSRYIQEGK